MTVRFKSRLAPRLTVLANFAARESGLTFRDVLRMADVELSGSRRALPAIRQRE
jgi:hypothetical protein